MTFAPREVAPLIWGKTGMKRDGTLTWLPLVTHLTDSAAVAGRLWDAWLTDQARRIISGAASDAPSPGEAARALLVFLAGAHDIGKATPAFEVKIAQFGNAHALLTDRIRSSGLDLDREIPDARAMPHGRAGQVILQRWLSERFGWEKAVARGPASVVGAHHGIPSSADEINQAANRNDLLGGPNWQAVQDQLLNDLVAHHDLADHLTFWGTRRMPGTALMVLSGLVVLADWIASNTRLFRQIPIDDVDVRVSGKTRLDRAWSGLDFPIPWRPVHDTADADTMLRDRFDLPTDAFARPLQKVALDRARTMDLPGLLILEAPMGEGKTEAALLAAEAVAARIGASGVFFALPTQATGDAMFARVLRWLERIPEALPDDAAESAVSRRAAFLAHGKARLDPVFRKLRAENADSAVSDIRDADDAVRDPGKLRGEAYIGQWFTDTKRGVLSDFVVGTIDQVLFTSLQARHVMLRHLAMVRKVVILDEVHAYSAFSGTYLLRALEWFGAYGIPVIALSATLPSGLRAQLMEAYRKGRRSETARVLGPTTPSATHDDAGNAPSTLRRPRRSTPSCGTAAPREVVTAPEASSFVGYDVDGVPHRWGVAASDRSVEVHLETIADEKVPEPDGDLVRTVAEALGMTRGFEAWRGEPRGCVLVLRNTVRRARDAARVLARELGTVSDGKPLVRLHHSRFIAHDRQRNDAELRRELGAPGKADRPTARVIVATQVAEQSLDIDVDLLITDLAPMDLILQRMGRLHRHVRTRPAGLTVPRCVITGMNWDKAGGVPELTQGTRIYHPATLLRAAAVVGERLEDDGVVRLPLDLAPLVEAAYADKVPGPAAWHDVIAEADREAQQAREKQIDGASAWRVPSPGTVEQLDGLLDAHSGQAEREDGTGPRVREGEDTFEVLLLERVHGYYRIPNWIDSPVAGAQVSPDSVPDSEEAVALARCAVRLPMEATRGAAGEALIELLEENYHDAWQKTPELKGQLVLPVDIGPDDRPLPIDGRRFIYDPANGLDVRNVVQPKSVKAGQPSASDPELPTAAQQSASDDSDAQLAALEKVLDESWHTVLLDAPVEEECRILEAIADLSRDLPAPTLGDEVGDGITLAMSWMSLQVTVHHDQMTQADIDWLTSNHWRVVDPDPEELRRVLKEQVA